MTDPLTAVPGSMDPVEELHENEYGWVPPFTSAAARTWSGFSACSEAAACGPLSVAGRNTERRPTVSSPTSTEPSHWYQGRIVRIEPGNGIVGVGSSAGPSYTSLADTDTIPPRPGCRAAPHSCSASCWLRIPTIGPRASRRSSYCISVTCPAAFSTTLTWAPGPTSGTWTGLSWVPALRVIR